QLAVDGCSIGRVELWRTVDALYANARTLAESHIPDGVAVTVRLSVQMRWARARHHRTTSSGRVSTGLFPPSRGMWIVPSGRPSPPLAPACFAARSARAMSACVVRAAVRAITPP